MKKQNMKMKWILSLMMATCISGNVMAQSSKSSEVPFVIPTLTQWQNSGEGTFSPVKGTSVCYSGGAEMKKVADQFAQAYSLWLGIDHSLTVQAGKAKGPAILFVLVKNKKLGNEGYQLTVSKKGVRIEAQTAKAAFWASQTLLQMALKHKTVVGNTVSYGFPYGTVTDVPKYAIRGFMLDCGRKYIPMDYLESLVQMMAFYKMNTLQVHLSDNGFKQLSGGKWENTYSAFRLECDTYPGLTARDGSYTKNEFRAFQKNAAKLGVEVIPEIDVPAHSLAFTKYMPEIGSQKYGMDHLDLFNPKTEQFVDGLFKEYLEGSDPVFVGKRVHVGTDEYSNQDTIVVEKFRAFTDHCIRFVESFGKQACVWGALTHAKGKTPVKVKNVLMNCWYNGYADPKEMKRLGYEVVSIPDGMLYIVPEAGYYYNYLNTKNLYDTWTPANIGNQTFEEGDKAILGGMFALWNDHAGNGISISDIHHRVYPAIQTLATKMWNGKKTTMSYEAFDSLRQTITVGPGVEELGLVNTDSTVMCKELKPGTSSSYLGAGYPYTVAFEVEGAAETLGTILTTCKRSTFYLSDPISGLMGYSRDGYLYTFNYKVLPGEKASICIKGTNNSTSLYVNGRLVEEKRTEMIAYNAGKDKMAKVSTLFFPLAKTGNFKSKVTNFKVYNNK
ncbi:MAG: family 20 glycosylhydrolase [Bacteroidaceae bacterium]